MGLWGKRIREHYADELTASRTTVVSGDRNQLANLPADVAAAFGVNPDSVAVTRRDAMSLPVVSQGRMVIAGTIGTFPLVAQRTTQATGVVEHVRRDMLEQPDPEATRQHTITWTIDDLLFYGIGWWETLATDALGYPVFCKRHDPRTVYVDQARKVIRVAGREVAPEQMIRFDGPDEGILRRGTVALRTALLLEAAARRYAVMDVPTGVLEDQRPDVTLEPNEIDELLGAWRAGRQKYGTGYTSASLKYEPKAFDAKQLQLTEARQHMATELARLMSLDADAVNAPAATGMTYNNGLERRRGRLDMPLRPYMDAITGRLSLGDVTPRGQVVLFDTSAFLQGDAGQQVTTAVAASGGPVMSQDEARARYLDLPPAEQTQTQEAPA